MYRTTNVFIDRKCSDWMAGLKLAESLYKVDGMTAPYLLHWFHFNVGFKEDKGFSFDFALGFFDYMSHLYQHKELLNATS